MEFASAALPPVSQTLRQLQEALLRAFPTRADLTRMVAFGLDLNLPVVAEGANLADAVFQLCTWAADQARLADLVAAALVANPQNPALQPLRLVDWAGIDALLRQPSPCPYPGMVPFRPEDTRFFYGRTAEIDMLLQHLRLQRFLMVIGPSGSGKSSLLFAGLLSRLATSTYWPPDFWLVRSMRPGATPLQALNETLGGAGADLQADLDHLLATNSPRQRLLLVIDQFEEVFTLAPKPEQGAFLAAVQALRTDERCAVILAMRADFYPDLMNSPLWPLDPSQRLEVAPLRGPALRQAVERPAADVGVRLEPGLLERLLADASEEPGVLPLLQETLVLLWGKMPQRVLPLAAYEELGSAGRSGLAVALATRADATLAALSPTAQGIARRIFLRLVQFGEGRPDTRRQQTVPALQAEGDDPTLFDTTLRYLADHRLLTVSGEADGTETQVDIAHEALISGWPLLTDWLLARREAEQTRRRLEDKAAEWARLGQGSGGLLDEIELREAERGGRRGNGAIATCSQDPRLAVPAPNGS